MLTKCFISSFIVKGGFFFFLSFFSVHPSFLFLTIEWGKINWLSKIFNSDFSLTAEFLPIGWKIKLCRIGEFRKVLKGQEDKWQFSIISYKARYQGRQCGQMAGTYAFNGVFLAVQRL